MHGEQLEFDFGPEFRRVSVKPDLQLYDCVLQVEIAIARADYAAVSASLRDLKHRAWDMFWGSLQSDPK